MPIRIKARNDIAANWTTSNPILAKGELGYESDTNQLKFGDGTRAWNLLSYVAGGGTFPVDGLRNSTPGIVMSQNDNTLVGAAFVMPGFYLRTATGWTFPPWLQQQSFERFVITTFPYTLTVADAAWGMVFLQPSANATVTLPLDIITTPVITNVRTYLDIIFYTDKPFTITFVPAATVQLFVPGVEPPAASYALVGPRRAVLMQARAGNYRIMD